MNKKKMTLLLFLFFIIIISTNVFNLEKLLTLNSLQENYQFIKNIYLNSKVMFIICYFITYILVSALAIPGAAVILTLVGAAIFDFWPTTIIVSFASSIGATFAFLLSRYILQESIQKKWSWQLKNIYEGIKKEGALYLFSLRLIPLFPFFLINIVMGLTPLKTFTFYWVSQIGMLPGTMIYVNAGLQLSKLKNLQEILSPNIIMSFTLIGIFPYLAKLIINKFYDQKVFQPFKKDRPKKYDYNMVVIGAGAGGLVTSYLCALFKGRVALIESHKMGGDCLNTGCVPSKALIYQAKLAKLKGHSPHFKEVKNYIEETIKKIEPHDSIERYENLGVKCFQGSAEILNPWKIKINESIITTKNITLAIGGTPYIPQIPGLENIKYFTSETIWKLTELPHKLLILGGGSIGVELGQAFQRLGSQVYLVHKNKHLLSKEDFMVGNLLKEIFVTEGMNIYLETQIAQFPSPNKAKLSTGIILEFDCLLLALGKMTRTIPTQNNKLQIDLHNPKMKRIKTNQYYQTNYPNIFACGDATGPHLLTHAAAHQAFFCAFNGLFGKLFKIKDKNHHIPRCTYTDPEIATVGMTENEIKSSLIIYDLTQYDLVELDRAITDNATKGFVRVLTKKGSDKILGVTIVSENASTMILEFILAMKNNLGMNKILSTIHLYPSMGEANKFVAGKWKQNIMYEKNNTYPYRILNNILKWIHK